MCMCVYVYFCASASGCVSVPLIVFYSGHRQGEMALQNLVDPASSPMLVSKIKPCMSQYKLLYGETANGSLKQL